MTIFIKSFLKNNLKKIIIFLIIHSLISIFCYAQNNNKQSHEKIYQKYNPETQEILKDQLIKQMDFLDNQKDFIKKKENLEKKNYHEKQKGIGIVEAIKNTISKQLDIFIQKKEIEINEANILYEKGQFDSEFEISAGFEHKDTPLTTIEELSGINKMEIDTSSINIGYKKKNRSGITINPIFQMTRTDNTGYQPYNNSNVLLVITIPLLKGSGIKINTANERAAEINYNIAMYDLYHKISEYVLQTTLAYWDYMASLLQFEQLSESLERARLLVEETQILINADERPASDLDQLIANLADRTASFVAGRQALTEARLNLGHAIGDDPKNYKNITFLNDNFSIFNINETNINISENELINESLTKRFDYNALKQREKYFKIQLELAEDNLKHQLDINLNFGYSGQDEGHNIKYYFSSLTHNVPGYNCSFQINMNWPYENNLAYAVLYEKKAGYDQSVLLTKQLETSIKTKIMIALSGINNSKMEIIKARESVKSYKIVSDNEKIKFKLGISTLIDLITTEDRLTNALRNEISAYQNYAQYIAKLRFETGTIVKLNDYNILIDLNNLITIPDSI